MKSIQIVYFTDILCVWAYIAQHRVDEVHARFGQKVRWESRFCPVFGDTARKMATTWGAKGGYAGFNAHLREAVAAFPEMHLNPDIWLSVRPASSASPHVFLKAAQLAEHGEDIEKGAADRLVQAMRRAFFMKALDISARDVQSAVAEEAGIPLAPIAALIADGRAFAALSSDYQDAEAMGIKGSPSFVMNEGRQKLYGNVGYKIIAANLEELLRVPNPDQASWC
jgi:predicted DsbA family dithiol-disulfide isomerase